MDAKELQAHILNNYGKPITEMGFVELIITLREVDDAMRYEWEREQRQIAIDNGSLVI
jgi:hypothetical protein